MSLLEHAEEEMRRAGLYDDDADYGGMIPQAVLALVRAHADQGHSGGSHELVMSIFEKVIRYRPLTPITDNPRDWIDVAAECSPRAKHGFWQCRRSSTLFSTDGGKTYYDLDEKQSAFFCRLSNWLERPEVFGRIYGFPKHVSDHHPEEAS